MELLKFSAKNIFDGELFVGPEMALLLQPSGTVEAMLPLHLAGDDVQFLDGIICPGFINTHCHLELSYLHNKIPEKTGMVDFILRVMGSRSTALSHELLVLCLEADKKMWENGIQAVGDICNTADTIATKMQSNIAYQNFIEVSGFVPNGAVFRFEGGKNILQQFKEHFPATQACIVPHAPYSVSKNLFQLIEEENPILTCIHSQESLAEENFISEKSGDMLRLYETLGIDISFFKPQKKGLEFMLPMLPKNVQKILVHNCFTSLEDLSFLNANSQKPTTFFCLCPNANLYIGNPLPNVKMLAGTGLQLCLGTDSLASNQQLSILEEMKTLQQFYPKIRTETLLKWATKNGADALKMGDKLGSFEKGKKPGVLQIRNMEGQSLTNANVVRIL